MPTGGPSAGVSVASALLPEQIEAIAQARRQTRKISRAAAVASMSGWTCAVFGGLTLLCGIFSLPAFLLGLGLIVIAIIELRGGAALRRFDLAAPRRLGWNQIALACMIASYCAWCIYTSLNAPGMYDEYLNTPGMGDELAKTLGPIERLQKTVTIGFYSLVIIVSLATQGAMAAYYFTRRTHIARSLQTTPQWTISALRAAA